MECTRCGGRDERCPTCGGWGHVKITRCPQQECDRQTWRVVEAADFAEAGTWPVAGGLLDQSHSFAQACRAAWAEERYWKRKAEAK